MTKTRLDMEGFLQDAAQTASELQDELYSGLYPDYSDDSAWDVQNAAIEFMGAIRRFKEQATEKPEREYEADFELGV